MFKWLYLVIIFIHGLIHLMGGFNELGLAKIKELSGKTLLSVSGNMQTILGVTWFIAVAMFLISAFALITNQQWWKSITIASVIISQVLILIWWPDAKWGTIANILIIIGMFFI